MQVAMWSTTLPHVMGLHHTAFDLLGSQVEADAADLARAHRELRAPGGMCYDEDDRCPMWASAGECVSNAIWMKKHCRKPCSQCPPTTAAVCTSYLVMTIAAQQPVDDGKRVERHAGALTSAAGNTNCTFTTNVTEGKYQTEHLHEFQS